MAQDLGARLVKAGLLSRGEIARAAAHGSLRGAALVGALVLEGLPEDALVGFFVSECSIALATDAELEAPDRALVRLVPRALADSHCALPLRRTGSEVLTALADPTDEDALAELGRTLGATVTPATATLSLLREAIRSAYARLAADEPPFDLELEGLFGDEPPVELVRRKPLTTPASPYVRVPSNAPRGDDNRTPQLNEDDALVPLVRTKAVTHRAPARASTPAPRDDLLSNDRWSTLPAKDVRAPSASGGLLAPATKLPATTRRTLAPPRSADPADSLPDVGPALAAMRAAPNRDEAVRVCCDAALPACRCAVFLALKRNVLQGRYVVGGGLSPESICNVWIPVTSASIFREAITKGTPHFGPYGSTAADGIYKAAIGAVGGDALVQPVSVTGKPIAVLCADDLRCGARGRQRLEALALALGDAFERLIVSHKK